MFIFSVTKSQSKKLLIIFVALILAVIISVGIFICLKTKSETAEYDGIRYSTSAHSEYEIQKFPQQFGLKVKDKPNYVKNIIIPEHFNACYEDYNALQKLVGLDLEKYKGRECQLYNYSLTKYKNDESVSVNLIVCGQKIIGGDISEDLYDGFMLSFSGKKA